MGETETEVAMENEVEMKCSSCNSLNYAAEQESADSLMDEKGSTDGTISNVALFAGAGIVLVVLLLVFRWRWKKCKTTTQEYDVDCPPCVQSQLVHKLCPHNNVVQSFEVQQKDSLDEHLDVLTRKLAEKEGRLRISKSKIRQTQNEIENLQAIDHDVRHQYRQIMESLRTDLLSNERECKKLQEQIEWVSRRRAELKEEVRRGQRLYGEAAAELANNLAELQKGRDWDVRDPRDNRDPRDTKVIDKPQKQRSANSLRHRKEPQLPRAEPVGSLVIKSPPSSPAEVASRIGSQPPHQG